MPSPQEKINQYHRSITALLNKEMNSNRPKPKIIIVVGESLRKRILADSALVDQQAAQFLRGRDGALSSWNDSSKKSSSSMAFATSSINQIQW